MRVVLKDCVRERVGSDLVVIFDPREALTLADPGGQVETLLEVLSERPRTVPELCQELAARGQPATEPEIHTALAGLDQLGLVEDGDGRELPDPGDNARHFSNLTFFGGYSGLQRTRAGFMERLRRSHVLVLGVGGGGSSLVMSLVGLGVGRLTLVDRDDLEPRNLARQFLYRYDDLGRSKVERAAAWVRAYDPSVQVRAVDRWIAGPADLSDLVDGVDVIAGGLDGHPDAPLWVNEAAVRTGTPHVVGGMNRSQLVYYSVHPGHSRCRQCDERSLPGRGEAGASAIAQRRFRELRITNGLIGPLAMQIGSLVAYETLRYLTGFEPPRAAGSYVKLDLRTGLTPQWEPFADDPECPVCPLAPVDRVSDAPAVAA